METLIPAYICLTTTFLAFFVGDYLAKKYYYKKYNLEERVVIKEEV